MKPENNNINLKFILIVFFFYISLTILLVPILDLLNLSESLQFKIYLTFMPLATIIFTLYWIRKRKIPPKIIGLNAPIEKQTISFLLPLSIVFLYVLIIHLIFPGLQRPEDIQEISNVNIFHIIIFPVSFGGIGHVIFSPFVEELVFRGIIYNYLKRFIGAFFSILGQAALFSLVHLQYRNSPIMLFQIFCIGIFLGFVFEKTRSIYPSFLSHSAINYLPLVFKYS